MGYQAIVRFARNWLVLAAITALPGAALAQSPGQVENVVLPDKPANEHWVWIGDFQNGNYARSILFNARSGERLGSIDMGWEGIKLDFARSSDEIYNLAMFMSRGFRGTRTDAIAAFDKHTLMPLREIVVPAKGVKGWPDPNHTALSDDDRFLFMQFLTPASSIGVADLKGGKYVGEIETTGCAHVMAAGKRRFFTLCGDGSILAVDIGEDGKELSRRRYSKFFDVDRDPLHGSGTRAGQTWYFVSHLGQVHSVDVSGAELKFQKTWPVTAKEGDLNWVPGAFMQSLAIHTGKGRLYVAMHASDLKPKGGGTDYHAHPGTQVWVFDLSSKQRVQTIVMKNPVNQIAVSQDAAPLFYGNGMFAGTVTVYDAASGQPLQDIVVPTFPTLLQPVN